MRSHAAPFLLLVGVVVVLRLVDILAESSLLPIVRTQFGDVRGFVSAEFPSLYVSSPSSQTSIQRADVFLGLPFAEPPLGDLRFEARSFSL